MKSVTCKLVCRIGLILLAALYTSAIAQESPSTKAPAAPPAEIPSQIGKPATEPPSPLGEGEKLPFLELRLQQATLEKQIAEANAEWVNLQRRGEQLQSQYGGLQARLDEAKKTFHEKLVSARTEHGGEGYILDDKLQWVPEPKPVTPAATEPAAPPAAEAASKSPPD